MLLFASIDAGEVEAVTVDERPHSASFVSVGGFDLDYPRSEIGERHRAEWPRENPAEVEDDYPVEELRQKLRSIAR